MTGLILILFAISVALGVPMAFGFGSATAIALLAKSNLPLDLIPQRMALAVDSFVLLAVPLFILGGSLMDVGGLTGRLVDLARALVGHVRGGLGIVVMVAEIFFSGISGSSTADTSAMASLFIPSMLKAGYNRGVAVAIINAATAMGVLVPPCTIMIFVAMIMGQSVAALFFAGFLPAFVIAAFLIPLVYWQAKRTDIQADKRATLREFLAALRQSFGNGGRSSLRRLSRNFPRRCHGHQWRLKTDGTGQYAGDTVGLAGGSPAPGAGFVVSASTGSASRARRGTQRNGSAPW